jgi:hypothetical protein
VILLSTAPMLMFEVVARSDIVANMALLMLITGLAVWAEERDSPFRGRTIYTVGGLFGCLAATRIALLPALGVLGAYWLRRSGLRVFAKLIATSTALFLLIVLPFVLWDPQTFFRFAPIGVSGTKLGGNITIGLGALALIVFVTVASMLLVRRAREVYVLILPPLLTTVLATWLTFFADVTYLQLLFVPLLFSLPQQG